MPKRPRSNGWLPVPGWTGEHEWDGMVPFEEMPHTIAPDKGMIVTANNRVVEPEREPYLSTDPMPPHRTRRIWLRLKELKRPSPEQMPAIHRDLLSIPAIEIRERLRAIGLPAQTKQLCDLILGWDGEMRGNSVAAAAYSAVRLELTKLALRRSGLDKTTDSDFTKVAPGLFPEVQFWWTLPQLLRSNDESLLKGATWNESAARGCGHGVEECADRRLGHAAYAKAQARTVGRFPRSCRPARQGLRQDLRRQ